MLYDFPHTLLDMAHSHLLFLIYTAELFLFSLALQCILISSDIFASKDVRGVTEDGERTNHSRQNLNVLFYWGVRRRGKTGKHGKVGVKSKWLILAQPPYSP